MDPVHIRLGSFITGVALATYNGSNRAVLDCWTPTDITEWRFIGWETMIQTDEVVLDEWAVSWLPTLGGWCFAEDAGSENVINGVRLTPPG